MWLPSAVRCGVGICSVPSSVSSLRIEFREGGVHLPDVALWMDPDEPHTGPERVFISHAHSDHIAAHREVILSEPTARLMQARLPGVRHEHVLAFGQSRRFAAEDTTSPTPQPSPPGEGGPSTHRSDSRYIAYELTLLPAGHIFGSAMALVQAEGQALLYTGDFKLRPGLSAEKCEPRPADILIMETTFGRRQYVFPPTQEVLKGVVRFCREALDNDEIPVLLGYSLGKSQELLCSLGEAGLPLMLHGSIFNLTRIYEQFGHCFPKYEPYQTGAVAGKVLLCPPHVIGSAMLRNLGRHRTAILTGWAVDPNCRYRYQCDAAFPLSDHADFPDLLELVKQVQPKKVYTLHGFAADFAHTLRQLGIDAQALSQDEQLALAFTSDRPVAAASKTRKTTEPAMARPGDATAQPVPERLLAFAQTCAAIGADSRKLEKIRILSEYLRQLRADALGLATVWFTGRPFASSQNKVLQLGWAVIRDALSATGRVDTAGFHQVYLKHSDLGETVAEILDQNPTSGLSLEAVGKIFNDLQAARGPLVKVPILRTALEQCSPIEARFFIKIITSDLRIGLKEGLVEEALAAAFSKPADDIRQVNLLLGDIGKTAQLAADDRLGQVELVPFRPIKFMLASPEQTAADIWARVQESARDSVAQASSPGGSANAARPDPGSMPAWIEDKYDGIRCQLHKVGKRVSLYSRDLKDISATFPEVSEQVSRLSTDFILDGEMIAMRGDVVLPFSDLQKRLGRRQDDLFMREEVPIAYIAFDCLWYAGASLLDRSLRERRGVLDSIGPRPSRLRLAGVTQVHSAGEIEQAFHAARGRGNEGLMIKDPLSRYSPGRRGLAWLKLKKALATLDCVVVGAEYGHGKRSKVLSDYTFAVRDERTGELKTIGKAYTGLTDTEISALTEHFLTRATRRHGRYFEVPPDTVLEIAFDRLQRSDRHSSGLAMRFPRIVRIRADKSPEEIDTMESALRLLPEENFEEL